MRRLAALLTLACTLLAPSARADRYALDYDGSWLAVASLGAARLDIAVGEDSYDATAAIHSSGLLRFFERTDLVAASTGVVAPDGVHWRRYDLDHSYSQKRRVTSLRLGDDNAYRALITPNYRVWGTPPASDADKRTSRDPLSSIVAMSIAVARAPRCEGTYPTFDGRFRYDLVLSGGARGKYDSGGYAGPILKCRLRYVPLAGYDLRDENQRRRLPEGDIWFALPADSLIAPPVRVSMPAPLGHAVISLKKLTRATVTVLDDDTTRPATAKDP